MLEPGLQVFCQSPLVSLERLEVIAEGAELVFQSQGFPCVLDDRPYLPLVSNNPCVAHERFNLLLAEARDPLCVELVECLPEVGPLVFAHSPIYACLLYCLCYLSLLPDV